MTAEAQGILSITSEEHRAIRALSNSGMKDLAVSPLRYWYRWINPAPKAEEEESAALRMGSALHCAALESDEIFESRYARKLDASDWPVCLDTVQEIRQWVADKGGKAEGVKKDDVIKSALAFMGKINEHAPILQVEEARFFAQNQGKTILSVAEWERLAGMAQALADEPALRPILRDGRPEVSLVARDPETGVLLKARLDWLAPNTTLDLKTFAVKRGGSIDKAIYDAIWYEGYHRQIVFYDYVRRLALGESQGRVDSLIAFVESDQPHETRLVGLHPKRGGSPNLFWLTALQEIRAYIRLYAECTEKYGDEPWRDKREIETLADEDLRALAYS